MDIYAGQDFAILAINGDPAKQSGADWVNSHTYDFTEWGWSQWNVFDLYNNYLGESLGIPQSFIIDYDGNVRYAKLGAINGTSAFTTIINELI